jgi:hypothetical protein
MYPAGRLCRATRGTGGRFRLRPTNVIDTPRSEWSWSSSAMRTIPRPAAWTAVVGNLAWSAGSIAAVVAARGSLTALGVGVVLVQAAAVAVFAEFQWLGLRRAR